MVNYHRTDQRARVIHALQLRIEGNTWQAIADQMDWKTEAGVRRAVGALLDKWESESVDQYRVVQDQRYGALLRAWWTDATTGDEKAARIVLRTMDAINKLHGLNKEGSEDAPRMAPDEFRALLAEYVALQQPAALPAGSGQ